MMNPISVVLDSHKPYGPEYHRRQQCARCKLALYNDTAINLCLTKDVKLPDGSGRVFAIFNHPQHHRVGCSHCLRHWAGGREHLKPVPSTLSANLFQSRSVAQFTTARDRNTR
jgi:hypothetical protein